MRVIVYDETKGAMHDARSMVLRTHGSHSSR